MKKYLKTYFISIAISSVFMLLAWGTACYLLQTAIPFGAVIFMSVIFVAASIIVQARYVLKRNKSVKASVIMILLNPSLYLILLTILLAVAICTQEPNMPF